MGNSAQPMEQMASVAQRESKLIVSSWSNTENFWIMNGWFTILAAETDDAALGQAIREALSRTESGIPTPPRAELKNPIPNALGLRGENAYMEGTCSVLVLGENGASELEVIPQENKGRDGFIEIEDAAERLPREIPAAQLAAAVRRAFGRCA